MTHIVQKIAVFFTGGTIGMRREADGAVRPALHLADLLNELPVPFFQQSGKETVLTAETLVPVEWADLPSPHMTPALMYALAMDVKAMLARDDVQGAVIAHGTDVMEETAFLCDLLVPSEKPLVVTGAMRSYDEPGYDGLRNLAQAIQVCLCPPSSPSGTVVLMADKLFAAREVTKVHSMAVNAFAAPGLGPIGTCVGQHVQFFRIPVGRPVFSPLQIESAIDLVSLAPGMDGRFLACARAHGVKGLVVEGFGAGNVPPTVLAEIELTLQAHIPVVLTSRCIEGGVWPVYGYSGGANQLQEQGVILGGGLSATKARLLLMVALGEVGQHADYAEKVRHLRAVFAQYQ